MSSPAACASAAGGSGGGGGGDGTWVALLAGARSHSRRGAASLYDALLARFPNAGISLESARLN